MKLRCLPAAGFAHNRIVLLTQRREIRGIAWSRSGKHNQGTHVPRSPGIGEPSVSSFSDSVVPKSSQQCNFLTVYSIKFRLDILVRPRFDGQEYPSCNFFNTELDRTMMITADRAAISEPRLGRMCRPVSTRARKRA